MSQFNFGNLGPPLSGAQLVDDNLEPWRDALHSLHSGTSRPSYAVAGMQWLDTTTNPWVLKVFDGTDDITLGTINTSTNVYSPSFGTAIVNADISASAAIALSKLATLSASRAVVTNGSGNLAAATTTATEIGYLNGVTSNIQTQLDGKLSTGNYITALTGDGTATGPGSVALTLATVNSNVGAFGSSTAIPSVTVNAKGLVTAVSTNAVVAPAGTLSGSTLNSGVTASSLTSVGTLTNLTVTNTISGSINGNAATATALATSRTIGGVSFDGTANIVPNTIVVSDTTDTTCFVGLWESATGSLAPKTDGGITYNASSGLLTAIGFSGPLVGDVTGNVTGNISGSSGSTTGNAATATALQTARNINGTAFDGTANITITAAAGTLTGTTLNSSVVTSSLTTVGTITTGTWQGTAVADTYIASAATWNAKQSAITGGASTITSSDLTANRALISNGSGKVAVSDVTATELGYLDGVTSAIQTQINGKVSSNTSGITGADAITNMVSLTQSEYDGITPNASTFYVITDA